MSCWQKVCCTVLATGVLRGNKKVNMGLMRKIQNEVKVLQFEKNLVHKQVSTIFCNDRARPNGNDQSRDNNNVNLIFVKRSLTCYLFLSCFADTRILPKQITYQANA